jgi:RHS repeat-associated protein
MFYSQDWQALEERVRTPSGAIPATADTRFIWSPVYVDAMVARDRNADGNATTGTGGLEERVYALQDANWNTTAIIAANGVPGVTPGTVINRFAYTPYGEVQTLTDSWAVPPAGSTPAVLWSHLFQGLKLTDVTGLAYVRHRDYSPTLGRFIERDPIGFEAGDNNWYRFVANGPTGTTDPSGLVPSGTRPISRVHTRDQREVLALARMESNTAAELERIFDIADRTGWPWWGTDTCVAWTLEFQQRKLDDVAVFGAFRKIKITHVEFEYVGMNPCTQIHAAIKVELPSGDVFFLDQMAYGGLNDHIFFLRDLAGEPLKLPDQPFGTRK